MTIPKAKTITYATPTPDPLEGFSHSVTIEPFKFQSEADSNLDLLLYGSSVKLIGDNGKREYVPLSQVALDTSPFDISISEAKSLESAQEWVLNNRNLVEDILKEGEK